MVPVQETVHQGLLLLIAAMISADLLAGWSFTVLLSSILRRFEATTAREYQELCHAVLAGRYGILTGGGVAPPGAVLAPWLLPVDTGFHPRRFPTAWTGAQDLRRLLGHGSSTTRRESITFPVRPQVRPGQTTVEKLEGETLPALASPWDHVTAVDARRRPFSTG